MGFFFFFVISFNQSFFSSLFSLCLPACALPSRMFVWVVSSTLAIFCLFLFLRKKTRWNFAFSPCFSLVNTCCFSLPFFFCSWYHGLDLWAYPTTLNCSIVVTRSSGIWAFSSYRSIANCWCCCKHQDFFFLSSAFEWKVFLLFPNSSRADFSFSLNNLRTVNGKVSTWRQFTDFSIWQRFDTNEEMVAHQAKHLTESKYKCELCGKHFPSQSSVWKHTKAHSGERPFVWWVEQ